ncbi:MAG: hypothetical protein MK086_02515 [Flavobacteriales bacterium]|nr:hypothetical protein [Flavobacteriales bacterium]
MRIFLGTIFLFLSTFLFGQFEGVIHYNVTYEAVDESKSSLMSMLPNEASLYCKGQKSLFEQKIAGGGVQAFASDGEGGDAFLMMQFLGQGYKVEMSQEQMMSLKQTKNLEIEKTDDVKVIAGYTCKRGLARSGAETLEFYYCTELESETNFPPVAKLDGLPLEYEIIKGGIKMKFFATSVEKMEVSDSKFEPLDGLVAMKFDVFAKSFAIIE